MVIQSIDYVRQNIGSGQMQHALGHLQYLLNRVREAQSGKEATLFPTTKILDLEREFTRILQHWDCAPSGEVIGGLLKARLIALSEK